MSLPAHDCFERLIAEHYEGLKTEVLATVRGKLAVDNLHPDPSDLDGAYNAAWHALYERFQRDGEGVSNLGGWLATITYRRAIDDIRGARLKYRAPVVVGQNISDLGYEHDVDAEITDRQRYHQWLVSIRLRLNARELQAVCLCVLHEHSRRDASEIMDIDVKRLDKIMVAANKKLGGLIESINSGGWCEDQRSLIKAYAFGLHEEGGERHSLAVAHLIECQACAAYVRDLRGLTVVVPVPTLLAGAAAAGGGILAVLGGLLDGSASGGAAARGAGTAVGGGGATLLGGIGAKTTALCVSAVCAAGAAVLAVESAPDRNPSTAASASASRAVAAPAAVTTGTPRTTTTASSRAARTSTSSTKRTPPDPKSKGAQEIAELGIEPQATSTPATAQATAASVPRAAAASEFDIEGP